MTRKYYAHTREGAPESEWQPLAHHLQQSASIAAEMGADAGISEIAYLAGLLHDIGKYSDAFQERLRGKKTRVDHATAGAKEIMLLLSDKTKRPAAEIISYCIAGHHSGLPDYGSSSDTEDDSTLLARRNKKPLKDYSAYKSEIIPDLASVRLPTIKAALFRFQPAQGHEARVQRSAAFSFSFLIRMVFSALVDADWIDTERFANIQSRPRGGFASMRELKSEFDRYIQKYANPERDIHRKRTETLHDCLAHGADAPGFFTLTVPTGGAKTLNSLAFALTHAVQHDLKRVIYVIPFTSIIEQNAKVFREALGSLGAENVLEHHSNFDWDNPRNKAEDEEDSVADKLKLASENWDVPIVVTTNVQFFESLYASKKRRARKLHNLAKSVIIFDEAQTLPRAYLQPCLMAIQELVRNYGASAVFSTATQPSLQRFFAPDVHFTELASTPKALFDFYKRVRVVHLGQVTDEALLERLSQHEQVLCIVNTRRHARGLFTQLSERCADGVYHLSTLMCPKHREITLETIRTRLDAGLPCRVISTQVLEAGIDVDFPVGYRALAGLDSIIQAAGRVNREKRCEIADMYVFEPETPLIKKTPLFIQQTGGVARIILRDHADDPTTIAAIEAYYNLLYNMQDARDFDSHGILSCLDGKDDPFGFAFKSAAENFKLIEDNTVAIMIPFDDHARGLIRTLTNSAYPLSVLRKLQPYTVNIYEQEFDALFGTGRLDEIQGKYYALRPEAMDSCYHAFGLDVPERSGSAIFAD